MVYLTANPGVHHASFYALDSLTQKHVATVLQAVEAMEPAWRVDQHKDYDGHVTIVITASDTSDHAPTFVVSGRVRHIELASMYGEDDLHECGGFSTIEAATAALIAAISNTVPNPRRTKDINRTSQNVVPED